jgi:hypothetical protein
MEGDIFWCDGVHSGRKLQIFGLNLCMLFAILLASVNLRPEDGGSTFLRNVCKLLTDTTSSVHGRNYYSARSLSYNRGDFCLLISLPTISTVPSFKMIHWLILNPGFILLFAQYNAVLTQSTNSME